MTSVLAIVVTMPCPECVRPITCKAKEPWPATLDNNDERRPTGLTSSTPRDLHHPALPLSPPQGTALKPKMIGMYNVLASHGLLCPLRELGALLLASPRQGTTSFEHWI